jgi:DNA topoisomerase I
MDNGTDSQSWWRRLGTPKGGFRYVKVNGRPLRSQGGLNRIEELAIPPAWTDAHIAPTAARRIQAWGRDDEGRKQYIYSDEHREERDRRKWDRIYHYGLTLPAMRRITSEHMKRGEPDREKVLALVVRLMNRAWFRVGGREYALQNKTFGISTLHKKHLRIEGNTLLFGYPGKGGRHQRRVVGDTPLVEIVEEMMRLPGRRLFRFLNGTGSPSNVAARHVNEYIQEIMGDRYSSKDARTFGGTVRAATILADIGPAADPEEARRNVILMTRLVAAELGNTATITREAYIHPAVIEQYEEHGRTIEHRIRKPRDVHRDEPGELYPEEAGLLELLKKYG